MIIYNLNPLARYALRTSLFDSGNFKFCISVTSEVKGVSASLRSHIQEILLNVNKNFILSGAAFKASLLSNVLSINSDFQVLL